MAGLPSWSDSVCVSPPLAARGVGLGATPGLSLAPAKPPKVPLARVCPAVVMLPSTGATAQLLDPPPETIVLRSVIEPKQVNPPLGAGPPTQMLRSPPTGAAFRSTVALVSESPLRRSIRIPPPPVAAL